MTRYRATTGVKLDRPDERTVGRFLKKVENLSIGQHCWNWIGTFRTDDKYGIMNIKIDSQWRCVHAHRLSLAIFGDGIPEGYDVHHVCGNHGCVNPLHLQLASRGNHNGAGEVPF